MPWTNITNAQLAVGAPIRSVDLLALRDNITAQANGDAGAPKQQAAGINFNTNGLQNLSGALAIACPSFNTVGSYCMVLWLGGGTVTSGSNYSAGSGAGQISSATLADEGSAGTNVNNLSGTWKYMGATWGVGYSSKWAIACRVS